MEFDEAGDEGVVERGEGGAGAVEEAQAVRGAHSVHGALEEGAGRDKSLCAATGQTHMFRVIRKACRASSALDASCRNTELVTFLNNSQL